jgi:hypothetical protein
MRFDGPIAHSRIPAKCAKQQEQLFHNNSVALAVILHSLAAMFGRSGIVHH